MVSLSDVFVPVGRVTKSPWAILAQMRFFTGVNVPVVTIFLFGGEAFATVLANKWF